jgi:hypothetical protein
MSADPSFKKQFLEAAQAQGIWVPEDNDDETVTVKGTIVGALYHPERGMLAVELRLPDGSKRGTWIHKSAYSYGGRSFKDVPLQEVDREMEKLAELYRRAKGRRINLTMYQYQMGSKP